MDEKTKAVIRNYYIGKAETLLSEVENLPIIPGVPTVEERERQIKWLAAALLAEYAQGAERSMKTDLGMGFEHEK